MTILQKIMSVRVVESRFNLRSVVEEEAASRPLVVVQSPNPESSPSLKSAPKSALRFNFTSIQKPTTTNSRYQPISHPQPIPEDKCLNMSYNLKNSFASGFDSNRADVMRLTAVVEDLNTRLKKANDKTTLAESQLQCMRASVVAEKASYVEKLRVMNSQVAAAQNTEAKLRRELSSASKAVSEQHNTTTPKFEAAVAAAVAADKLSEKSRQKVDALEEQLSEQLSKTESAADEAKALKEKNVEMSSKMAELEVQLAKAMDLDSATGEAKALKEKNVEMSSKMAELEVGLAEAKESERKTLEERDSVAELLKIATEKMDAMIITEANVSSPSSFTPSLNVESPEVDTAVSSIAQKVQTNVSNYPDPIKMHARYNRMRDAIIKVSACIVAIESGEAQSDQVEDLRSKRDELFNRAKELKSRYDTIFGAVDPQSVVELTSIQPKASNDDVVDNISFLPEGDSPSAPCTHVVSFAKEMAQCCSLGGAFDFGSYDSGVPIGNHFVTPIMSNSARVEPTDGHDAQNEMVNAVVADMTNFLKGIKQRDVEGDQAIG